MRAWAAKRYELRADVYTYHPGQQDPDTGAFLDPWWDTDNPVIAKCTGGSVKPYQSLEDFSSTYRDSQMISLVMPYRPSLRDRLGKVRSKSGEILFTEVNGSPTTFDVFGVFPQNDSQGRIVDYQVVCVRGVVQ